MGAESRIRTLVADAIALPEDEGDFDLILCDAPCSGTGTLARNPEIRHRLRPEELKRQAVRQKQLLAAVAGRLKPGGRLVYSTCSLEQEENEAADGARKQRYSESEYRRRQRWIPAHAARCKLRRRRIFHSAV
jgi:16S rRNA (cytosine967-C5)-methyltransferase